MVKHKKKGVIKFVAHSKTVLLIAKRYGWLPAARYTNLRDVRNIDRIGFLDIDWKNYNFTRHLKVTKEWRPFMTVAKDVERRNDINRTLDQAWELSLYCEHVVIIPKDMGLVDELDSVIPDDFLLGYSVPTRYGGTRIPAVAFKRPVHLLGGRPDVQRKLADIMPVFSLDCNRFTLDAAYGDYFDGEMFRPHPIGGYERCVVDSVRNINALWNSYDLSKVQRDGREKCQ